MTFPCINEDHFEVDGDGALQPRSHMQWRHVATNSAASVQNTYDINGGNQAADLFQLQVSWVNSSPLPMNVYGLLTRGGSTITSAPRNRTYIETYWGAAQGAAPADPTASTLHGRFGVGADLGTNGGVTAVVYANQQTRQAERTSILGSTVLLPATHTYKLRIRLRFDGAFFETLPQVTSEAETELSIITGATRLDLYAYPDL
jgi:hypothetical protein